MRIRLSVDRPAIEAPVTARNLFDDQIELAIGRGNTVGLPPKESVIPSRLFRLRPLRSAFSIGILNHCSEAILAIIVVRCSQNPDPGRVHAHDGIDAFRRADLKHFYFLRLLCRIAIERHNFELVRGQRHIHSFGCARVQEVKQDAISLPNPDRLPVTESLVVKREGPITHLESIVGWRRRAVLVRFLHRGTVVRFPLMHGQKNLTVIVSGIILRFDIDEAELAGIKAAMKVFPSKRVAVVPTRTGWLWSEAVPSMPVWRNCRTTFLPGTVGFA